MDTTRTYPILRIRTAASAVEATPDAVAVEYTLTVAVGEREVVGMHCSPCNLTELAVGFLFGEGILEDALQIAGISVDESLGRVDVSICETGRGLTALAQRRIQMLTSACGHAVTFSRSLDVAALPVMEPAADPVLPAATLAEVMREFVLGSRHEDGTGCLHRCAILAGGQVICVAGDVGRHNAVDKVIGHLVLSRMIPACGCALLTTGRLSSDIVQRAAVARLPVVASRAAPTSRAVDLADSVGMTLIGFVRGERMNVYTHPSRISVDTQPAAVADRRSA